MEHVPRPPDPRVRDPEVRRRPRRAELLRPPRRGDRRRGRSSCCSSTSVAASEQRWFTEDLFRALLRLRGMESNAPTGEAEAFYCRKAGAVGVTASDAIDGVHVIPLRRIPDERGTIFHMLRADDPHFIAVRRDLLHEHLCGHRQGLAQAPRDDAQLRLHLRPDQARALRRSRGLADRGHACRRFSSGRTTIRSSSIPPGIWTGFKGMSEPFAIVANCCTHPHDPSRTTRLDPFDNDIPVRLGRAPALADDRQPTSAQPNRPPWATSFTSSSPSSTRSAAASPATACARRCADLGERIPLELHEVPSGTQVFDWTIPREWNIRDAYIEDARGERGRRLRALATCTSSATARRCARGCRSRSCSRTLHTLPEQPDWIPYRTSYYAETGASAWPRRAGARCADGDYEVLHRQHARRRPPDLRRVLPARARARTRC